MRRLRSTISVNRVCFLVSMAAAHSVCVPMFLISGNSWYSEDNVSYTALCVCVSVCVRVSVHVCVHVRASPYATYWLSRMHPTDLTKYTIYPHTTCANHLYFPNNGPGGWLGGSTH